MSMNTGLSRAMARVNELLLKASLKLVGDDGRPVALARLPTGIAVLDAVLGGGFVRGRVVEVYGPPSGGKTELALRITAGVQRGGGGVAIIDVEGSLDAQRAHGAGVDLHKLVAARPSCGEEALQMVDALLKAKAVDVVVVDSVAALVPRAELLAPVGEAPAGLHARLMSTALRRLVAHACDAKTVVVFLNQLRNDFDDDGKAFVTTTGGSALHFYAATRVSVRKQGDALLVQVVKDRFGAEGRIAVITK